MLPLHPASVYRPTKTDQGHGTYDESMSGPTRVYLIITVHENRSVLVARRYSDIRPEDRVLSDGAWYRVTDSVEVLGAEYKRIGVERMDKPIVPETVDLDGGS
jgi:hypothetical protein